MTTPIPRAEIEADLAATDDDIRRLRLIAQNISEFIANSHGENRSAFKTDALKYDALLSHALDLRLKIKGALVCHEAAATA